MKTQSTMLHVRMDTEMKRKATETLAAMGADGLGSRAAALPPHRRRSGFPARTQGSERADPRGHGRIGGNDETGQGAIRERGRDVCGA